MKTALSLRRAATLPILLLVLGAAQAASTVYRCGTDGRSYSDAPCAVGRSVELADMRSETDRAAGTEAARREKALAEGLRRERQAREAENLRLAALGPARIGPALNAEPSSAAAKKPRGTPPTPRKRPPQRANPKPKKAEGSLAQPPQ